MDMETDLQVLLCKMEGRHRLYVPMSVVCLLPGFQSSQAICGQLFSMECLFPLPACSCWNIGMDSLPPDNMTIFPQNHKPQGSVSGLLSYKRGSSLYPLHTTSGTSGEHRSGRSSVPSSGSGMRRKVV